MIPGRGDRMARSGTIATPINQEAAPYVARTILDFDIDAGIGQVIVEAPPNAGLLITSVGGWGQTADKVYGLGIAPPGWTKQPGQAGKLAINDPSNGPYPLAFGIATLNGATADIPYSLMNNDRVASGNLILPAGWALYVYLIQTGNSGTLSVSASGIYLSTYQTLNFQGR